MRKFALVLLLGVALCRAAGSTVKIRGYITSVPDSHSIAILDDVIATDAAHLDLQNCGQTSLSPGLLIEAEGVWGARHQFAAEKVSCDANQFSREISENAYLQEEPVAAEKRTEARPGRLKADGELLLLTDTTQLNWHPAEQLVGYQVHYRGVRQPDGSIVTSSVELGSSAPADAYKNPGGVRVVPTTDPKTGIKILEFQKENKIQGRMKLFPVEEVQEYVRKLGLGLLPHGADATKRPVEFRFFVVEDPSINAFALPDGTILINTGLVGAVENEAQLAFVLSHEISHVLQAHHWREVHDTRPKRVLITIAAVAASYYIRDLGLFLGQLGLEAVVNGYSRRIENQADRLGLQNVIDHGYDPRPAAGFFRTMLEHYRQRSTSAIWSNHDSALLRGSFLSVQLLRQYPEGHFDKSTVNSSAFAAMRDAMGPVKIE